MTRDTIEKKNSQEYAKLAAKAHTNLCTFSHIVGLLECNNLSGYDAQKTAQQITELCQAEQRRQLMNFDNFIRKIKP